MGSLADFALIDFFVLPVGELFGFVSDIFGALATASSGAGSTLN